MKWLKNLWLRSRKSLRFSIENPRTFSEIWSFNGTGLSVISLILVVLTVFAFIILFLFSGTFSDLRKGEVSIEREQLEKQREEIEKLTKQLEEQENYILAVRRILSGEAPVDSDLDSLYIADAKIHDSIRGLSEQNEKELAKKVRDDSKTGKQDEKIQKSNFASPVKGLVSQKYDKKLHPGIDVVTKKDEVVKSCQSGTVIYAGFTRKDGYILLIDHSNGFISVYKHNKMVLKKIGDHVKLGDPVAIVGNTGENTDGPHLHFELWYNQNPVNPTDYFYIRR